MGGGGDLYGQPAQQDLAGIPRVDTPEDAYEGGLAGAVLADEGVNFARAHFERHILQRADTREGFGDALHLEKRHVHGWHVTFRRTSRNSEGHSTLQDDVRVRCLLPGPHDGPHLKERTFELLVRNMLQRGRAQEMPRGLVEGGTALPHLLGDGGRLYLELIQDRLQRLREGRHS